MDGFGIFLAIVTAALALDIVGTSLIRTYFKQKGELIVKMLERSNQGE
jgi:hypothetical protein